MTTKNSLWRRVLTITAALIVVFAVSFLFAGNVKAATVIKEGVVGDTPWSVTSDGVLTIGEEGKTHHFANFYDEKFDDVDSVWPWYTCRDSVKKISIKGNIIAGNFLGYLFCDFNNVEEIQGIENIDTSKVWYMGWTFYDCKKLKKVNVTNWNTKNVDFLAGTFQGCKSLKSLDLSKWNTSKVWDISGIFSDCSSLKQLNVSTWDTSNIINFGYSEAGTFQGCKSLKSLDLSNWCVKNNKNDDGQVIETTTYYMFINSGIEKLKLGKKFEFKYYDDDIQAQLPNSHKWQLLGTNNIYSSEEMVKKNPQQQNPGWYVKPVALTGFNIKADKDNLTVGDTAKITPTFLPADMTYSKAVTYTSSNPKIVTVDNSGKVTANGTGTATITAKTNTGVNDRTATASINVKTKTTPTQPTKPISKEPSVLYKTQVQTYGWEKDYRQDGNTAGTQGKSKRLEAIQIKLENQPYSGNIEYRTHIQTFGWEKDYRADDKISGTVGLAKRLEAIQIRLTGDMAKNYDVYYRVHAQHFGWLDWAKNDQKAGTSTYGYRLEAIQIKLVKKGQVTPGKTTTPYRTQGIQYTTHVQRIGWQPYVSDGAMAGTKGRSLRLEGIRIKVNNELASGNILYRTHVQTYGWEKGWRSNDQMSGTSGQAKRLEAIEIKLTGDMAKKYDVYYRVHAQHFGDLGWAKNGENAGTAGYGYRLEGIRIQLVPKGGKAPGPTTKAFKQR